MPPEPASGAYHDNAAQFREALLFTEAQRGFTARLIEKDYFCSLVLQDALPLFDSGLTFKGGTSLSKVHTDFYRLSEDLDFVIHVEPNDSRDARRRLMEPVKQHISTLPDRLPILRLPTPLQAHNQSTQYIGQLFYRSSVTGEEQSIKIEISTRLHPTDRSAWRVRRQTRFGQSGYELPPAVCGSGGSGYCSGSRGSNKRLTRPNQLRR